MEKDQADALGNAPIQGGVRIQEALIPALESATTADDQDTEAAWGGQEEGFGL